MLEKRKKELVRIARILIINGEMDLSDVLDMFNGDMDDVYQFVFRQKKVLSVHQYENLKSVRANLKGNHSKKRSGFEKLLSDVDKKGRAWTYYKETFMDHGVLKSISSMVKRHLFVGHALNFIMDDFDIDVWKRPSLSEMIGKKANGEKAQIRVNTFYGIREVKGVTEVGRLEYMHSIASGVLLLPGGVHTLYYLPEPARLIDEDNQKKGNGNSKKNWGVQRETRFLGHVNRVFRALDSKYIPYDEQMDNVLVIGNNKVAAEIFKGLIKPDSRTSFTFDKQAVRKISFIKDNEQGKRILRLLKIPGMQRKVIENKVPNKENIITSLETEDAVENGLPILFWLDGDLKHLYNALSKDREGQPLYVICEEEYMDLVDELSFLMYGRKAQDLVKVSKISVEEIERITEKG